MKDCFRKWWQEEDGTATISAVMWMPIFIFVLALVVDTATIFSGETRVLQVVQDANRALAVGRLADANAAQQQIATRIASLAPNATVSTQVSASTGLITSTVSIPLQNLAATGLVSAFNGTRLTVVGQMLDEG